MARKNSLSRLGRRKERPEEERGAPEEGDWRGKERGRERPRELGCRRRCCLPLSGEVEWLEDDECEGEREISSSQSLKVSLLTSLSVMLGRRARPERVRIRSKSTMVSLSMVMGLRELERGERRPFVEGGRSSRWRRKVREGEERFTVAGQGREILMESVSANEAPSASRKEAHLASQPRGRSLQRTRL